MFPPHLFSPVYSGRPFLTRSSRWLLLLPRYAPLRFDAIYTEVRPQKVGACVCSSLLRCFCSLPPCLRKKPLPYQEEHDRWCTFSLHPRGITENQEPNTLHVRRGDPLIDQVFDLSYSRTRDQAIYPVTRFQTRAAIELLLVLMVLYNIIAFLG